MFPDTDTVLVKSVGHDGTHAKEVVDRAETTGGNVALRIEVSLYSASAVEKRIYLVLYWLITARWWKILTH